MICDGGATRHCTPHMSDLCKITCRNPNGCIRVGNGERLPVTAIGTMRTRVRTRTVIEQKGKKRVVEGQEVMTLTNVLCVPEMKVRLFSCDWGYKHDGIKTMLNDERCLMLPSGSTVPFKPTDKHYVISTCGVGDSCLPAHTF